MSESALYGQAGQPGEAIESMTAQTFLRTVRKQLEKAGIEEASYEAWMFLEWICGIDRGTYYMDPEVLIPEEKLAMLSEMLTKRTQRVPLQYLMGSCEFMGFTFCVDESVLIPRQDTECLVEAAVNAIRQEEKGNALGWKPEVLDLCTGSGCIGISIKKMCPNSRVTLSDISEDALSVAALNAKRLGAELQVIQGDLFEHINGTYHFIISNPPYIPTRVINTLMPEVREHEPHLALDGTEDGLEFYRRIIREAKGHLTPSGWLLFEIGMDQGEALKKIFALEGYRDVEIRKDLAGLDRIAVGCLPE